MVRIRLKRTGTRNLPCYRVVVVDQRSSRDGKTIEEIGFYDPRHDKETLNLERYDHWIAQGAQPSDTAADIARRAKDPEAEAKKKAAKEAKLAEAAKAKEAEEKKAAEEAAKAKAAEEAAKAEAEKAAAEEAAKAEDAEEKTAENADADKGEDAKSE